jgi:ribosomal protein S18 acetylase RimI-like enzyme
MAPGIFSQGWATEVNKLMVRPFGAADEARVIELWRVCDLVVPWNDPASDIAAKLAFQPDLLLVAELEAELVATVMAGYEGHRGWINYLAVDPALRRRGLGRALMEAAERRLRELGCPKINLQVRGRNRDVLAFYEQLGYSVDDTVSLGKRLQWRRGSQCGG